ncbi:unnamed protein product [Vitrella brassicaformis CCMP3155]|uniref:Uncharacterized protein n=1 Tax=Vitrella brassicaformis (strain CCMP3155) TaxID=1169540 RepID=A0A0G4EAC4_VITBC|nr:unnamed protein product [Vitrella brassicaformis CCMP3155]|eukprot:CEL92904.1 unnamed protein product [Vitrella brassicaformis CCMP3155]
MGNHHSANRHSATIDEHTLDFLHKVDRDALHTYANTHQWTLLGLCLYVCAVCNRSEVGSLRATAHFLWEVDFSPYVLRNRLNRCLAAKGLHTVVGFDALLDRPLLLKAIWLVDTQQWNEVADALKLAAQRGFCQLPMTLAVADLQRHDSKQAYLADVRVIGLWKMVGRHVNFGGQRGHFELFDQPGGGVRALRDEPGFELDVNPPLPANHPYHPHIIDDNPPVRSRIGREGASWTAGGARVVVTDASVSSFIMRFITRPPEPNRGETPLAKVDRHAHGGVLDGILNHSPHQPPDGCTAVMAGRCDDSDPPVEARRLVLTPFDSPFSFVFLVTTEPPVGDPSDVFKDRRPSSAPLVRGLVGDAIAATLVYQTEKVDEAS